MIAAEFGPSSAAMRACIATAFCFMRELPAVSRMRDANAGAVNFVRFNGGGAAPRR